MRLSLNYNSVSIFGGYFLKPTKMHKCNFKPVYHDNPCDCIECTHCDEVHVSCVFPCKYLKTCHARPCECHMCGKCKRIHTLSKDKCTPCKHVIQCHDCMFGCTEECEDKAKLLSDNCREAVLTLILTRKFRQSDLSVFPKDILLLIAKELYKTRKELVWNL